MQHRARAHDCREDAKRPNRERDCLVGERTRIVNRIKSTLARLGIRTFKPTLPKTAERLATVHTPEGVPLPPNTLAELQRDMARLGFVVSQIRQIEDARQKRLEQRGHLLSDKEYLLARVNGRSDDVGDSLRFSGSWGSLDNEISPLSSLLDNNGLRAVGV